MSKQLNNNIFASAQTPPKATSGNWFRSFVTYFCVIVLLTGGMAASLWHYFTPENIKTNTLLSPVPDFLQLQENNQVTILDLWSPVVQKIHGSSGEMDTLTAHSVLMYDLTTDKILYDKDADVRRPMASLTKIMTAIIALENPKPDDKYLVREADIVGEDSMGLYPGEVLSREELLYGLMLPSGNDAAEVLANNFPTGRAGFLQAMNDKAKAMGLKNTQFSNPSGLQGDGVQYTTTYDLLVMTRYALEHYPLFRQIVTSATHEIPATDTHQAYSLVNETNLLTTYQGVKGVKTGFTPEAGMCLVTYLEYGGHEIIGVILNSENRRGEMKQLLDYSLKTVGVEPPPFEEAI